MLIIADGCKVPSTPQVIEESMKCIANKFLKILSSTGAGNGVNTVTFKVLQNEFQKFDFQLDLVERFLEVMDDADEQVDAEEQIINLLTNNTTRQSVPNYWQVFIDIVIIDVFA